MTEKFQVRSLNGEFQVYSSGLEHWAMCPTEEKANQIADALNSLCKPDRPDYSY